MKVSIIMGIFNCAETLSDAIKSILSQTYSDWELIMCDDGSTDNTFHIAQTFASKNPNIVLIKNDRNMGLNYTLNRCLELATGEYIARMDGDDISLPNRLEEEVSFLDQHPQYAIVSTPMIYFDENGVFRTGKGGGEKNKRLFHAPARQGKSENESQRRGVNSFSRRGSTPSAGQTAAKDRLARTFACDMKI